MILGSDHILPSNYVKNIIAHMDQNKDIAICLDRLRMKKVKFQEDQVGLLEVISGKQ